MKKKQQWKKGNNTRKLCSTFYGPADSRAKSTFPVLSAS